MRDLPASSPDHVKALRLLLGKLEKDGRLSPSDLSGLEALRSIAGASGVGTIAADLEAGLEAGTIPDPWVFARRSLEKVAPGEREADLFEALEPLVQAEELRGAGVSLEALKVQHARERLAESLRRGGSLGEILESVRNTSTDLRKREHAPPNLRDLFEEGKRGADSLASSGFKLSRKYAGDLSAWWNTWAGPAGRITAGRKILFGAASESGKTTISNWFALSALDEGIPVLYYQTDLPPAEHLGDLLRMKAGESRKSLSYPANAEETLRAWGMDTPRRELLRYPSQLGNSRTREGLNVAVEDWASEWKKRRAGEANTCTGLLIVDYLQNITDPEARSDHKALEDLTADLAALAGTYGLAVLALSQMGKGDQKELGRELKGKDEATREWALRSAGENSFAGGDLRRAFDSAVALVKVQEEEEGKSTRYLVGVKGRGVQDDAKRVQDFRGFHANGTPINALEAMPGRGKA